MPQNEVTETDKVIRPDFTKKPKKKSRADVEAMLADQQADRVLAIEAAKKRWTNVVAFPDGAHAEPAPMQNGSMATVVSFPEARMVLPPDEIAALRDAGDVAKALEDRRTYVTGGLIKKADIICDNSLVLSDKKENEIAENEARRNTLEKLTKQLDDIQQTYRPSLEHRRTALAFKAKLEWLQEVVRCS